MSPLTNLMLRDSYLALFIYTSILQSQNKDKQACKLKLSPAANLESPINITTPVFDGGRRQRWWPQNSVAHLINLSESILYSS